jgi:hypothetical protein
MFADFRNFTLRSHMLPPLIIRWLEAATLTQFSGHYWN